MDLTNFFYYYTDVFSIPECNDIIKLGLENIQDNEKNNIDSHGRTFGQTEKDSMPKNSLPKNDLSISDIEKMEKNIDDYYIRDSRICWFHNRDIFNRVYPYVVDANKKSGWNWDWDFMENFQFSMYNPGNFYSWHTDGGSDFNSRFKRYLPGITNKPLGPNGEVPSGYTTNTNQVGKIRKISIIVTLSSRESYEGGELKFDFGEHYSKKINKNLDHLREPGTIIIFPSFLQHCVTPVKSGVRYSLVSWCSGDPWK